MKLHKLRIKSLHHLQNLAFDFTYPANHSLAGKPLNKICIIGQSATGKTSILEFIKESFISINKIETIENTSAHLGLHNTFNGRIEYLAEDTSIIIDNNDFFYNHKKFERDFGDSGTIEKIVTEELKMLYFSSDLISKEAINLFNQNPINLSDKLIELNSNIAYQLKQTNFVYEFLESISQDIWFAMLHKIIDYRKRFTQMASELINNGTIGNSQKLSVEYAKWSESNENPIIKFATFFDPLLAKLNLKIDVVNTEYAIPFKSLFTDHVIPISALSTGTKSLLLSMFPIYELDTKNSIILIDEPERSLFPDMQIDLINHYCNIAPDA